MVKWPGWQEKTYRCNQRECGWREEFNHLFKTYWLKGKRLDSSKHCEISLCRWWAGRWSKKNNRSNLVSEGLQYRENTCEWRRPCSPPSERWRKAWFRQRRASDCSSLNWVGSWKSSLIRKKTMKNSFALDPSNPGKSIQETDKHMNSKKIVNLANPTDQQDTVTKKYVDEK